MAPLQLSSSEHVRKSFRGLVDGPEWALNEPATASPNWHATPVGHYDSSINRLTLNNDALENTMPV
jgi:hypothetical protein